MKKKKMNKTTSLTDNDGRRQIYVPVEFVLVSHLYESRARCQFCQWFEKDNMNSKIVPIT